MIKNALKTIWEYLKDWKNLLSHSIFGLLILAIGLALPVAPIYRVIILIVVIGLNVVRMRYEKNKSKKTE